ncbi:glycoside hydrolase superfamily [Paraphoma chrysanthemicola]|nr:glycoside hydrolase superfamily [Paraphoma chrysanthemicola]
MRQHYILLLGQWFAPAATAVYTGFNYGAFWGTGDNVKKAADFRDSFNFAKNISSPQEVKMSQQALLMRLSAVETKTNLLLGFWISPGTTGAPLDNIIKTEMSALSKGFQKHGQALADLVIGLSVGSEDIHRFEDVGEAGVAASEVTSTIKKVRDAIAASDFAEYMKKKPIGHVDVAKHVIVDGADFYGMTAYPYWSNDSITKGNERFHSTLEGVKQRAGNIPVWIAEMGWPFEGPQRGDAVASAQNLQTFWTEVGCSVVGKYNTFWFELIKDSEANQHDWGMIDSVTHKPRIDLSCPGGPKPGPSEAPVGSSTVVPSTAPSKPPNAATIVTNSKQSGKPAASLQISQPAIGTSAIILPPIINNQSTTHITTTVMVTVQPKPSSAQAPSEDDEDNNNNNNDNAETIHTTITSTTYVKHSSASSLPSNQPANTSAEHPPKATPPSAQPTILPIEVPWCITVADIAWDGNFVPVAGHPAGPDGKCTPPPVYTGLPYGVPAASSTPGSSSSEGLPNSTALPISSSDLMSSKSQGVPSASTLSPTTAPRTPTAPLNPKISPCHRPHPHNTHTARVNQVASAPTQLYPRAYQLGQVVW